ncbi:hypothetical protein [Streptomyces sp. NPDC000395]|uniref:hypothetical protein n=1 Tax=Streptomyces sp. NPDC000395 TaxID=3154252 RepID=UPI00336ABBFD
MDLVRTLRDLGLDLAVIRQVLDREVSVPEVATAHADALDVQIRTLRLGRAVLRAVAKRGSTPQEVDLMHKLAKLSDEERRRLVTTSPKPSAPRSATPSPPASPRLSRCRTHHRRPHRPLRPGLWSC